MCRLRASKCRRRCSGCGSSATRDAENDPRWIAANDAAEKALAVQDELAVKLLETQPTTIAGAAALLTYYVDVATTTQPEIVFPELDGKRDFVYFIVRNVAAALNKMAAAGEAIKPRN
jgi:hypothetical protein